MATSRWIRFGMVMALSGAASCVALDQSERDQSEPSGFEPDAARTTGGDDADGTKVVGRLRTRSGVHDLTVDRLGAQLDGHSFDVMKAWAGTDARDPSPTSPFDRLK